MDFGEAFHHQDDSEVAIICCMPPMTGKFQCTLTKPGSIRSISVMTLCIHTYLSLPQILYILSLFLKGIRRLQQLSLELKGQ